MCQALLSALGLKQATKDRPSSWSLRGSSVFMPHFEEGPEPKRARGDN